MFRRKKKTVDSQDLEVVRENSETSESYSGNFEMVERDFEASDVVDLEINQVVDVVHHAIDGAISVTNVIGGTISNIARSYENIKKAQIDANVRIAQIASDFNNNMAEEADIHEEVMTTMDNVSTVVNHVVSTPELNKNPDVVVNLLYAISDSARQSVESRKQKKK